MALVIEKRVVVRKTALLRLPHDLPPKTPINRLHLPELVLQKQLTSPVFPFSLAQTLHPPHIATVGGARGGALSLGFDRSRPLGVNDPCVQQVAPHGVPSQLLGLQSRFSLVSTGLATAIRSQENNVIMLLRVLFFFFFLFPPFFPDDLLTYSYR